MKFLFSAKHGQLLMQHDNEVRNRYFFHFTGRILVHKELINVSTQASGYLWRIQLEFLGVINGRLLS